MSALGRVLRATVVLAGCQSASEQVVVPRDGGPGPDAPAVDRPATDLGPAPVDRPTRDAGFDVGAPPADRPPTDASSEAGPAAVDRPPMDVGSDARSAAIDRPPTDAGSDLGVDAVGGPVDAGRVDAGRVDTGRVDTGRVDTGPVVVGPDPVSFSGSFPGAAGRGTATLTVGGRAREVLVYVPRTRGANPPLLVLFHGTDDTAGAIFAESAAQRVADDHGVVVAAPQAVYQSVEDWDHPDREGNWWETYPSVSPETNRDLLLVRAVFVAAQRAYAVDPARIYLLGHSNGAFFAQLAANALGERVAAWASSSGGLCNCPSRPDCSFAGDGTTCAALSAQSDWCRCSGPDKPGPIRTTGRRPPAYLTHGSRDYTVSVYYTCALASRLAAAGFEVETVIRSGEDHIMPDDFAVTVWPWLFRHRRD